MKPRGSLRSDARRAIKALVLELARDGTAGRALALAVEAAYDGDREDRARRRAWSDARRAVVGRLRHREGRRREWAGVMGFAEGGEG